MKYLELAYKTIPEEQLEKYKEHPERDTHPKFFYRRDIINDYERLIKNN